jgi:hypothetical protein
MLLDREHAQFLICALQYFVATGHLPENVLALEDAAQKDAILPEEIAQLRTTLATDMCGEADCNLCAADKIALRLCDYYERTKAEK